MNTVTLYLVNVFTGETEFSYLVETNDSLSDLIPKFQALNKSNFKTNNRYRFNWRINYHTQKEA